MLELLHGRVVTRTAVEESVSIDGERSLIRMRVEFADGEAIILRSAPSADAVIGVAGEPLKPYDMAEYGHVEVVEDTEFLPPGSVIAATSPLVDSEGDSFGYEIRLATGARFYLYDWGDDLNCVRRLPRVVEDELAADSS